MMLEHSAQLPNAAFSRSQHLQSCTIWGNAGVTTPARGQNVDDVSQKLLALLPVQDKHEYMDLIALQK